MIRTETNNLEFNQERVTSWKLSRGSFLKSIALLGVSTQLVISCNTKNKSTDQEKQLTPLMTNLEARTIRAVQSILFPNDGNGPSAEDLNAFEYLLWFLQDELLDDYDRKSYGKGATKVNKKALELYQQNFIELSLNKQEEIVALMVKDKKTKMWFSRLITYLFEALLADPIYGGNPNNIGWDWLAHNPGQPRPTKEISYPTIFETVERN